MQRNLSADCQQNWPVQNDQEDRAYSDADPHTAPKPPMVPCLGLIVIDHGSDSIAGVPWSKEQMETLVGSTQPPGITLILEAEKSEG